MGSLRLVGSLKSYVSFAKEPYKTDYILQKKPTILRRVLIVGTPYCKSSSTCSPFGPEFGTWLIHKTHSHIHSRLQPIEMLVRSVIVLHLVPRDFAAGSITEHFTPLHPFSSDLGAFLQDGGSARLRTHSYTRTYTRTTVESVEYCCGSQCDRAVERILEITRSLSSRNTFCFFEEYLLLLQVVRVLSSSNTIVVWNEYVKQFHVFTVASMNHSSHPWKSHISLLQKSPIKETILQKRHII